MTDDDSTVKVRISQEELDRTLDALRPDSERATLEASLRDDMRRSRVTILNELAKKDCPEHRRQVLLALLVENRESLADLDRRKQQQFDNTHAERMADLAEASNRITQAAADQAQRLERPTRVLAVATVVLAVATVVLIGATIAGAFIARS